MITLSRPFLTQKKTQILHFAKFCLFIFLNFCLQAIMAGDMMLLMRGLAKLSQAVAETQGSTLRSGAGEFNKPFTKFLEIYQMVPFGHIKVKASACVPELLSC